MNNEARQIIAKLGLMPLPREGGFYRVNWISAQRLPSGRAAGSAIYFFLGAGDFSALHRLETEELWHFYAGDAVEHSQLNPSNGKLTTTRLGVDALAGQVPQLAVSNGIWQGARILPGGTRGWALLGCSLSPAWDEAEFELGESGTLLAAFPAHAAVVRELTR